MYTSLKRFLRPSMRPISTMLYRSSTQHNQIQPKFHLYSTPITSQLATITTTTIPPTLFPPKSYIQTSFHPHITSRTHVVTPLSINTPQQRALSTSKLLHNTPPLTTTTTATTKIPIQSHLYHHNQRPQQQRQQQRQHPLFTQKRFTAVYGKKMRWGKGSKDNSAHASAAILNAFPHKIQKKKAKHFSKTKMSQWPAESLARLMGEARGQRSIRSQSTWSERSRELFTRRTASHLKRRNLRVLYRRKWSVIANNTENRGYDTLQGFGIQKLKSGDLGIDAIYKYKPTPNHLKFRSFAIHPRPIESNLITGNEKTADKILPPDYMDQIFNQPHAGKSINERFTLIQHKLHYNVHEYNQKGIIQRILTRLFHVSMPRIEESLNLPNMYRRRIFGSNEVFVHGCWIDRREIYDFFTAIAFYSVGVPSIVIIKAKMDNEKLQGYLIDERIIISDTPLQQRQRFVIDSDRNSKPEFQLIQPSPSNPLLD